MYTLAKNVVYVHFLSANLNKNRDRKCTFISITLYYRKKNPNSLIMQSSCLIFAKSKHRGILKALRPDFHMREIWGFLSPPPIFSNIAAKYRKSKFFFRNPLIIMYQRRKVRISKNFPAPLMTHSDASLSNSVWA